MTSLTFMGETYLHYIPLHNVQAQPRRVSGVGWSAGLGARTCSLKVINARRYNSEPWKIENFFAPLLEVVRILNRKTPTRHPGPVNNQQCKRRQLILLTILHDTVKHPSQRIARRILHQLTEIIVLHDLSICSFAD
ncbi:MAG: hypothetical protein OXI15_01435 [Chromatiales bacterium]|nr:hypothetical protein [Chromatiales bacterium]